MLGVDFVIRTQVEETRHRSPTASFGLAGKPQLRVPDAEPVSRPYPVFATDLGAGGLPLGLMGQRHPVG